MCTSCTNILLCQSHRSNHLNDERQHNIIRARLLVTEDLKLFVKEVVSFRLHIMNEFSDDIIGATHLVITEVIKSNHLALKVIADSVAKHAKVMEELVQECPEQEVPVQGEPVQEEPAQEELVQEELV